MPLLNWFKDKLNDQLHIDKHIFKYIYLYACIYVWRKTILIVRENSTHKVAVEALTELKHARSVGQRPRDVESLTSWNIQNTEIQNLVLSWDGHIGKVSDCETDCWESSCLDLSTYLIRERGHGKHLERGEKVCFNYNNLFSKATSSVFSVISCLSVCLWPRVSLFFLFIYF